MQIASLDADIEIRKSRHNSIARKTLFIEEYHSDINTARISSNLICFFPCLPVPGSLFPIYFHDSDQTSVGMFPEALDCPPLALHAR